MATKVIAAIKNGYFTPACGHGETDGNICDCCLLAMDAHEGGLGKKCSGCRQCLGKLAFDAVRFDYHWKISVRTEKERGKLMRLFRDAGFEPSKEVFWHGYPGAAPCRGFTVAVTGNESVLRSIMRTHDIDVIAWTGV